MISKKGMIVMLLVVAVLLSVFSLVMSFSVDSPTPKGDTSDSSDLAGNVGIEILPATTAAASTAEGSG